MRRRGRGWVEEWSTFRGEKVGGCTTTTSYLPHLSQITTLRLAIAGNFAIGRVSPAHARHLTPRRGASAGPHSLLPHFSRSPFIVNDRGIIRGEFLYIDRLAGRYYCFTNLARCHAVVQFAPREARSCDETWPHRLNGDLSSYGRLIWMNRRACRLSGCLRTSRIHGTGPKRRFIADLTIFHG